MPPTYFATGSGPGNGISGIQGDVINGDGQVKEVKKWTFKPKVESKDYASNVTVPYKKIVSSIKSGTGTIDGVWDPWNAITDYIDVGSYVVLKLQHTTNQFWLIPAMINDMSFDVDMDTGDVETWTASYLTNGAWTRPVTLPTTVSSFMAPRRHGPANPLDMEPTEMDAPEFGAHDHVRPSHSPAYAGGLSPTDLDLIVNRVSAMILESLAKDGVHAGRAETAQAT